jgi:hypothetical protein
MVVARRRRKQTYQRQAFDRDGVSVRVIESEE